MAILTDDSIYILSFNQAAYEEGIAALGPGNDEGVEGAFDVIVEVSEKCFVSVLFIRDPHRSCRL